MKTFNKSFSSIPLYLILVMIFFASTPRASARTTCGSLSVSISSPLNLGDVVGNTVPASGLVTVPDGEVEEVELVFVIDVSGSMEDDNLYERQNEIVTLISQNMELSRSVRMALVSFSDGAAIRQNLTQLQYHHQQVALTWRDRWRNRHCCRSTCWIRSLGWRL